jgi:phage terminase large subunit
MHAFCMKYAGVRVLMVRKTLIALTSSAMVAYRENVLGSVPSNYGVVTFGGNKLRPAGFVYPNGSMVTVGGMDKPDKIKSTEFEMIVPNEATELSLEDYEMLVTRLHRNPKSPYTQILADCNPDAPTHWLYERMTAGKVRSIKGHHQDNPALYDHDRGVWTDTGALYIDGLDSLTGVRYSRMRLGEWVAAEGMVFDRFDPQTNLWSDEQLIEAGILSKGGFSTGPSVAGVIASVDWGYTKPGVLTVWAYDRDGRAYCIYQVYQTQRTLDWWIPKFQECAQRFNIRRFIPDPSEPSNIAQCNSARGLQGKFYPADNSIRAGVNAINQRMPKQGDGRSRLVIRRDGLEAIDGALKRKAQPTCLQEEIPVYVWKVGTANKERVKEEPIDEYNHACDTMRYAMMELDNANKRVLRGVR